MNKYVNILVTFVVLLNVLGCGHDEHNSVVNTSVPGPSPVVSEEVGKGVGAFEITGNRLSSTQPLYVNQVISALPMLSLKLRNGSKLKARVEIPFFSEVQFMQKIRHVSYKELECAIGEVVQVTEEPTQFVYVLVPTVKSPDEFSDVLNSTGQETTVLLDPEEEAELTLYAIDSSYEKLSHLEDTQQGETQFLRSVCSDGPIPKVAMRDYSYAISSKLDISRLFKQVVVHYKSAINGGETLTGMVSSSNDTVDLTQIEGR